MKTSFRIRTMTLALSLLTATVTNAQVPLYNSYPSASAVVFLDFDGHTVNGTSWNYNGPIVCGASGLDNSQITEVFNRVAEDYRPFDINITTDSTRYLAAPTNSRIRVIVTVTSSWYGSAGGVSFVGSFSWGDNTPCFVFSQLLNYNVKNIAEAASHEAGHTLGLYHQASYDANCNKISDYNPGQGAGEIGWAPIMGVGYYQNLTLWNNGPNSYGCANYQSDLDIITSAANSVSYRADDYGNTFASAATASLFNNQFNLNGVIERNTDQDMFSFTLPSTGRFQLNAVPYHVGNNNAGSDLDLQVTLYNASQTLLNVYNPGTLLSSVIDTTLSGGLYYLKIEGKGNLYAPNYASLGSYSLSATATAGSALAIRRLELHGLPEGDKHHLTWTIDADDTAVSQALELSTDGRNFHPLVNLAPVQRDYVYRPSDYQAIYYRLAAYFPGGRLYYSNVLAIRPESEPRPRLVSNLVHAGILAINSPGDFEYSILNMDGRMIRKGRLVRGLNQVDAGISNNGMYLLRYSDANRQWTDKFIRQ
jgi:hypothetical protein